MHYAVDFDGTLCSNAYPEIGAPNFKAIQFVKDIQTAGHKWCLYTCREGDTLKAALDWLKHQGLAPDVVNDNFPELIEKFGNNPRKVYADVYIDDHNAGGSLQFPVIAPRLTTEVFNTFSYSGYNFAAVNADGYVVFADDMCVRMTDGSFGWCVTGDSVTATTLGRRDNSDWRHSMIRNPEKPLPISTSMCPKCFAKDIDGEGWEYVTNDSIDEDCRCNICGTKFTVTYEASKIHVED